MYITVHVPFWSIDNYLVCSLHTEVCEIYLYNTFNSVMLRTYIERSSCAYICTYINHFFVFCVPVWE